MKLVSLTVTELKSLFYAYCIITAAVCLFIFITPVFWGAELNISGLWRAFTTSLTISTFGLGFFANMTWKSERLAKWLGRPIVHGVWRGRLNTVYKGESRSIEIAFVIRQTFMSLSIESFTQDQEGESKIEALIRNSKTQATRVCYIFELKRQYKGENRLTTGAGDLKLIEAGKKLKGNYWTNSPTDGDIELTLISRECSGVDCFSAVNNLTRTIF